MTLQDKHILVGISGGIAAYKSADLVRRLKEVGADVRVVMTEGAQRFITPLTLQAVSGNPVHTDLLDPAAEAAMGHIELARWADFVLVAPASANFMSRLAQGKADDLLSTLCLATQAPVALAPAMNRIMWSDLATQDNAATLRKHAMMLWGPGQGDQACGETGEGRMLEPVELRDRVMGVFEQGDLSGLNVVVTAGPTREAIDPVRFLTNRSTGRMGFAVAEACAAAGANVELIAGPVSLPTPPAVKRTDVESAQEMHDAVMKAVEKADIIISAAAVADYRPQRCENQKIKKSEADMTLVLERTTDIIATVAARYPDIYSVGFAAETHNMPDNARAKRERKGLNMVAGNWVGDDRGFAREDNALIISTAAAEQELPAAPKKVLARQLVELIAQDFRANGTDTGESQHDTTTLPPDGGHSAIAGQDS